MIKVLRLCRRTVRSGSAFPWNSHQNWGYDSREA